MINAEYEVGDIAGKIKKPALAGYVTFLCNDLYLHNPHESE